MKKRTTRKRGKRVRKRVRRRRKKKEKKERKKKKKKRKMRRRRRRKRWKGREKENRGKMKEKLILRFLFLSHRPSFLLSSLTLVQISHSSPSYSPLSVAGKIVKPFQTSEI
jgi:hypothetical protein